MMPCGARVQNFFSKCEKGRRKGARHDGVAIAHCAPLMHKRTATAASATPKAN